MPITVLDSELLAEKMKVKHLRCVQHVFFIKYRQITRDFLQVEKVLTGHAAHYGGLKVHDFLVSVNGQEVFEMNHDKVVALIRGSGNTLNLIVER